MRPKEGKEKEEKIKEKQGRRSKQQRDTNRIRLLNLLRIKPWTLGKLSKEANLSSTNTWKHLKKMLEEGLIKKTLSIDGKVEYEIKSKNAALENYVDFTLDMIRFTYGNELYPDIEERIRQALKEDVQRRSTEQEEKKLRK